MRYYRAIGKVVGTSFLFLAVLTACGGGGGGGGAAVGGGGSRTYTIGGTVTGLGSSLLVDFETPSGTNGLNLYSNGPYTYPGTFANGDAYNAYMHIHPAGQHCTVSNSSGTINGADVTNVDVNCEAGASWRTTQLIETDNAGDASGPQIAVDTSGNAIAVWQQSDGTRFNIWANHYTAGSGWGTAVLIETDDAGNATAPQIAIDSSGNAIAVWTQNDGARNSIRANSYTAGSGWGTPAVIDVSGGWYSWHPQIAIDGSGNAMVVWQQFVGAWSICANRYTAGSGWGTAAAIETSSADADYPHVAVDSSGNAMAVWQQTEGAGTFVSIWANRYTPGGGWGTAGLIETGNVGNANNARVAFDSSGNAIAVWSQFDGQLTHNYTNLYTAGSGWGTAARLAPDSTGEDGSPQIAFDSSGNAIAIWKRSPGDVMTNHYTAGSGWGTAAPINSVNYISSPQVAFDSAGNAMAVWLRMADNVSRYDVWTSRYTAGVGWAAAELVEFDNSGGASGPQIAFGPDNHAFAVWSQSDGTRYNLWSNRFE